MQTGMVTSLTDGISSILKTEGVGNNNNNNNSNNNSK